MTCPGVHRKGVPSHKASKRILESFFIASHGFLATDFLLVHKQISSKKAMDLTSPLFPAGAANELAKKGSDVVVESGQKSCAFERNSSLEGRLMPCQVFFTTLISILSFYECMHSNKQAWAACFHLGHIFPDHPLLQFSIILRSLLGFPKCR